MFHVCVQLLRLSQIFSDFMTSNEPRLYTNFHYHIIQSFYHKKAGRNLDPDGTLYTRARVKFFDNIKTYKSKNLALSAYLKTQSNTNLLFLILTLASPQNHQSASQVPLIYAMLLKLFTIYIPSTISATLSFTLRSLLQFPPPRGRNTILFLFSETHP
jgi:hypothetical protein